MMTSWNRNIFPGKFPAQRSLTRSFDIFFDHYDVIVMYLSTSINWGWVKTRRNMHDVEFAILSCVAEARRRWLYIYGSVQDCCNSGALAMQLLWSCTEP